MPWWQTLVEILLIFGVFFLQGAWPVPDNNEPYYLGKAIHFWNSHWIVNDFFLDTADTHWTFYFTFGWLSLLLSPTALAWTGRMVTWALLAWSWQRLSYAVLPRRWWSVLSGSLAICMLDRSAMAGEWIIGGVEAKGFAYPLVFLGLEALVRAGDAMWHDAPRRELRRGALRHTLCRPENGTVPLGRKGWSPGFSRSETKELPQGGISTGRKMSQSLAALEGGWWRGWRTVLRNPWNRAWFCFGAAGFFHVLVGGWSAVAAGLAWLFLSDRPPLRSMAPGLIGGLLLALPSLYSSARLDAGVAPEIARRAHEIYVFERLPHHLDLKQMPPRLILRFTLLAALFGVFAKTAPKGGGIRVLNAFVLGALAIALAGGIIDVLAPLNRGLAAGLLRFYWFRLSDVAVPIGVSLLAVATIDRLLAVHLAKGRLLLWLAVAVAAAHAGDYAWQRPFPVPPRSDQGVNYVPWRRICDWIAHSGQIPEDARFITPRNNQTFKWYARRAEVATWKDIPQDAASITAWWDRLQEIYGTGSEEPGMEWYASLNQRDPNRLMELGAKYGADYLLTEAGLKLPLKPVKKIGCYVIYKLR